MTIKSTIKIDIEKCKGCQLCVEHCPQHILIMNTEVNEKGYYYSVLVEPEKCIGCANCAVICPDSVISVYKWKLDK